MQLKTKLAASAVMLGLATTANAELSSVSDAALAEITGQAGLTIDMTVQATIGAINYTDTDGWVHPSNVDGLGASLAAAGTLGITNLAISNGAGGGLDLSGLTVDVDAVAGVVIGLPAITGAIDIGGIDMGTGISIGSVSISNLDLQGTTIAIRAH